MANTTRLSLIVKYSPQEQKQLSPINEAIRVLGLMKAICTSKSIPESSFKVCWIKFKSTVSLLLNLEAAQQGRFRRTKCYCLKVGKRGLL
jgi:hypothetical protein